MHIGAVCTRQVVTCTANATILEVAKLMRSDHVGDVVVVEYSGDDPMPIGIVTDRDFVIEVMAEELDPDTVTAGDLMSGTLVVAYEGEGLDVAIERMHVAGIRRVPVVDSAGVLVGIVTLDDIVAMHAPTLGNVSHIGRLQHIKEQCLRP